MNGNPAEFSERCATDYRIGRLFVQKVNEEKWILVRFPAVSNSSVT
jgi:hypothetical protein